MNDEDNDDILLDYEIGIESCPVYAGDAAELGGLGRLVWFRCTCCGMEIARTAAQRDTAYGSEDA